MSDLHRMLVSCLILLASLTFVATPGSALNTTVNNSVGDLDGDGDSGAGEANVINAAAACWDARITTNRNYTLAITGGPLTGGTTGQGAHTAVDGNNVPTAGNITIDNDGTTNWVVDATPLDNSEFTPDPASQWRFINGPTGNDLYRTVIHEIGHAQGWICGASCNRTSPDNVSFDAMMNPQPANFTSAATCAPPFPVAGQAPLAGCVFLTDNAPPFPLNVSLRGDGLGGSGSSTVNELSHPGVAGDLMIGFGGSGTRETPSFTDVDMFRHAYGDTVNLPPTVNAGADIVDECSETGGSTITLDAGGSTDPESDGLTFAWSCDGIALSDPAAAAPSGFFAKDGTVTCRLDATDLAACNPDADTVDVTVIDTTDPVVSAPVDVTAECTGPGGTPVALGMATATDVCDASVPVSNDAPGLFPLGPTVVTWSASDDDGNTGTDTQTVTVEDTTPPTLSLSLSQTSIWPANHKLVSIDVAIIVDDVCDAGPVVRLVSITSSEPVNSTGDGNTVPDVVGAAFGTDDRSFELRAERRGGGDGRTYTIVYEASDASGNTTQAEAQVFVRHDRR